MAEWQSDNDIIRKIWNRMGLILGENILNDINIILISQYFTNLDEAARYYAEWRYFTGERDDNRHFNNAELLPTSNVHADHIGNVGITSIRLMGFGGTRFIEFIYNKELVEVGFNGDDDYSWIASIIEKRYLGVPTNHLISLNSNYEGSIELVSHNNLEKFILTPLLNTYTSKIYSDYSIQWYEGSEVFFFNKISGNDAGGNFLLDDIDELSSGDSRWLHKDDTHNIKTMNERFENTEIYKHNNWNENSDVFFLSRDFTVQSSNNDQNANFVQLYPATIRNTIDDLIIDGEVPIEFNDPWYVKDENDNQSGLNDFIQFSSPYYPTGKYNESSGGVFLNQIIIPNNPYYSVRSLITQDAQLSQTGRTHRFYFQNWSSSETDPLIQNNIVSGYYESPVVFRSNGAEVTANLKGTNLSNEPTAYDNNTQRKFVKSGNGVLHSVYISMGILWYERSTDGGQTWYIEGGNPLNTDNPKGASIDYLPGSPSDDYVVVAYQCTTSTGSEVWIEVFKNGVRSVGQFFRRRVVSFLHDTNEYDEMNAEPVVALNGGENYKDFPVVFKVPRPLPEYGDNPTSPGLYRCLGRLNPTIFYQIDWYPYPLNIPEYVMIPSTGFYSEHLSIADNLISENNNFHLVFEENSNIYYWYASGQSGTGSLSNTNPTIISFGSGYPVNYSPSISLANNNPVVSWTGYYSSNSSKILAKETESLYRYKVLVRVGPSWGSFTELGNNVNYVNNNSAVNSMEKTVFVWSEGTTPQSKWAKRTSSKFSSIHDLGISGIQAQVTDGADYEYMTGMLFNNEELPYVFTKIEQDFSVLDHSGGSFKITEGDEIAYGRSGIVSKNRVEFVFNIGDVFVGDSSIQFMNIPDTLLYNSATDINAVARTVDFYVDQNTAFYFSNLYYVIRKELADTALTEDDQVNFKAELVKSQTGEVVGVFDNITYDKFNLGKYASINYQVDCSGVQTDDYYLRLVVAVIGDADYNLSNIQRDNFNLNKLSYVEVLFSGELVPETYELSQNYPNPFNPSTTIKYQLPANGNVTLKIYDILGSEVATLVDDFMNEGKYEVNFNASKFASGVYLYRLKVNDFVDVKKMILLK